jgi:uncharacterized protein YcbK (DUF882 family)
LTILTAALTPSFTENAVANGDTRTLYLYHQHTKEEIAATYLVNGRYDQSALDRLNWFLRDWRRDEPTTMDPHLFDVVWEAYRTAGASEPVHVVSAYRSPETNAMLRRRSRAVARYSQHMLGKAMDTTMPGLSMSQIREIGMRMQRGGVGYYPNAGTPFVHLDVGSVRSWPRMSYDQLARLFPDGKTVHLPTNNQPLARYEEAKAEIEARGGSYAPVERKSKSFFAFLFGGGEEDEDAQIVARPPTERKQWASLAPRNYESDEEGAEPAAAEKPRRGGSEKIAAAERNLPRGETALAPGPVEPITTSLRAERGRSAPVVVASLEAAAPSAAEEAVAAPLPPRRPANLWLAYAPLPPARPLDLALPAGIPSRAAGAIAGLIDTLPPPRDGKPEPLLAYATPPSARVILRGAAQDPPAAPSVVAHAALAAPTPIVTPPPRPRRVDFVPARLDRSNFQALTATTSASRLSNGSALGSTIGAPRSAARAEAGLYFAAASKSEAPAGFVHRSTSLPTDRFVAAP